MHAPGQHGHRAPAELPQTHLAGMAAHPQHGEGGQIAVRDVDGALHAFGQWAPAGAQHDGDLRQEAGGAQACGAVFDGVLEAGVHFRWSGPKPWGSKPPSV